MIKKIIKKLIERRKDYKYILKLNIRYIEESHQIKLGR